MPHNRKNNKNKFRKTSKQDKPSKQPHRGENFNSKALKKDILSIFADHPDRIFDLKQISHHLHLSHSEKQRVNDVLSELFDENKIDRATHGTYRYNALGSFIVGLVDMKSSGSAYITSEGLTEDIFISQTNMHRALHGDEVKVRVFTRRKRGKPEGEIVEIIKRARQTFVGTLEISRNFAFLVPDNPNMHVDIFIPQGKQKDAKNGDKAVARIVEWDENARNPVGEIIDVLGAPGENNTEMHAILAEFELPYRFEENVEKQAEKLTSGITSEEIARRRDFRQIPTFTIDPADAKDFDDALSIRRLDNGLWEVGVHIADVTFYVQPNTVLDNEAFERATSVYLVDRVVPMLPEKLSNFICSLRPHEEKFCYSAVFELDDNANIINQWFGRTVINSDRRFSYEEAQAVIDTQQGDMRDEMLTLYQLSQKLRQARFNNGSIAFDRVETKFHIDAQGRPTGIYFKQSKAANYLIEEFMLLANRKVAELIGNPQSEYFRKTFVYRIHDEPDPEKLTKFSNFLKKLGYSIQTETHEQISTSINTLMKHIDGKPEEDIISSLAVRAMAKAVYSTQNIGHYGLAFKYYSHFTSPIRRYPDMMVHRLLDMYLQGKRSASSSLYAQKCKHSSDMERRASLAERASIRYKEVEFMQQYIGQVFEGVISGVTDWGMYVEIIENKIEGLVALRDMDDDFYLYDEENFCITAQNSKRSYRLGNNVKIQIVKADLRRKQLDFMLYKG